jgi:hypothetical protein
MDILTHQDARKTTPPAKLACQQLQHGNMHQLGSVTAATTQAQQLQQQQYHISGSVSPKTSIDRIAVELKLKDVVATVAVNDEVMCMARVKEVVITILLTMSMPSEAARRM